MLFWCTYWEWCKYEVVFPIHVLLLVGSREEGGCDGTRDEENCMGDVSETHGMVVMDVQKLYGKTASIKNVSVTLECGEVTSLLCHNGAGKMSLGKLMSCDISPTSGDVLVFGSSVTKNQDNVRKLSGVGAHDD